MKNNFIKNANPKLMAVVLAVAGLSATASGQTVFNVATAQDFQNALTTAAGNGAGTNIIQLANGYYTGNFNYNTASGDNSSLVIEPQPGLATTNVTIDGAGLGRDLNISCGGSSGDVTLSGMTFLRNCGNYQIGALRIAAATGGNINVGDCQFLSNTNMEGMGIEVAAGQNTTIANCTVAGNGNSNGSYDANGNGVNISGVTGNTLIYDNSISENYQGDGVYIAASAALTVTNNVVLNNYDTGLYFSSSSGSGVAQVSGNVFSGNSEGGCSLRNFSILNLTGNIFSGNSDGGSSVSGTSATIANNMFNGNNCYLYGGGGLSANLTTAIVNNNSFIGNFAYGSFDEYTSGGGGASIYATTNIIVGNTFNGNAVSYAYYNDGGGGAFVGGTSITISNNAFSGNYTVNGYEGGSGGAVCLTSYNFATIADNNFVGNSCSGNSYGGAIYLYGGTPTIIGNTFEQNSSADGGGAIGANNVGYSVISDNLLVNNSQSGGAANGGGIFVIPTSYVFVINNTIFGNTSGGGGGGLAFQTSGTQALYVFNNIIWGNSAVGGGADVFLAGGGSQTELLYNDVNGLYGVWDIAENLLNIDPKFFNSVAGDYHFPESSPCANAGTNGAPGQPLTDLDGNDRTNSLGQIDLGCYQFNNTAPHPADTNGVFAVTANEFNAYAAAWKNGQGWTNFTSGPNPIPIPANFLTRAGYLMTNGSAYTNDGSARPTNWKLAQ